MNTTSVIGAMMLQLTASAMFVTPAHATSEKQHSSAAGACTDHETWVLPHALSPYWRADAAGFYSPLSSLPAPARIFSEALTLKKISNSPEVSLFAEYWISRALYQAGQIHAAASGFSAIAEASTDKTARGIQVAAIECLLRISEKHPTLGERALKKLQPRILALAEHFQSTHPPVILQDAALRTLDFARLEQNSTELLRSSPSHVGLARGFHLAYKGQHSKAIETLKTLLDNSESEKNFSGSLAHYKDSARLMLARSLYAVGRFDEATDQLKQVSKSSNLLSDALSELAWSFLLAEKYGESIGTALSLQRGGLRHSFAPESSMIMAMAMNELCQFPEALRALQVFRHRYGPSYLWLKSLSDGKFSKTLYPTAVQYLRDQRNIPAALGAEWTRSPFFLAHQDEINLVYAESRATPALLRSNIDEQTKQGLSILSSSRELGQKIRKVRKKQPDGELSPSLKEALSNLKRALTHYRRLRRAEPLWRQVLIHQKEMGPRTQQNLVAAIENRLKSTSQRMFLQLEEIAENNQLIEIEIFNGASQDLIWQNANPEYRKIAAELQANERAAQKGRVWNWGSSALSADDSEIWEDELDSARADIYDNCSSKDKYLALRKVKTAEKNL